MHNWSVNLEDRVSFDEPGANGKVILKCGNITVIDLKITTRVHLSARSVVIWQFRTEVTWARLPPSELNCGTAFWIRPVIKAGLRHAGAPGRLMTWRPFKRPGQHFWESVPNSFTCGNLSLLGIYFLLFQWRLSAASRCPVFLPLITPHLFVLLLYSALFISKITVDCGMLTERTQVHKREKLSDVWLTVHRNSVWIRKTN